MNKNFIVAFIALMLGVSLQSSVNAANSQNPNGKISQNRVVFQELDGSPSSIGYNLSTIVIDNGTLSTANIANGGIAIRTGAPIGGSSLNGTNGSILFINPGQTIAQDNSNFYFDNTNNRLGLGTTSPTATLNVEGSVIVNDASANDFDVRIETATYPNTLFIDGSSDMVGHRYTTPYALMTHNGGVAYPGVITYSSATSTVGCDDAPVAVFNTASNSVMADLPAVATCKGKILHFVRSSASNTLTMNGNAAEQVNGANTQTVVGIYNGATLFNNGTAWFMLRYSEI